MGLLKHGAPLFSKIGYVLPYHTNSTLPVLDFYLESIDLAMKSPRPNDVQPYQTG
jgi:hypothetical protein